MCSLYLLLMISMMSLLLRPSAAILALMVLYKAVPPFFVAFCWSFTGDFALFIFPKFIFSNYRKKFSEVVTVALLKLLYVKILTVSIGFVKIFTFRLTAQKRELFFMHTAEELNSCIKSVCKQRNVSIGTMLSECGLSEAILRQKSDKKVISCFSLARIADYLDMSADYLLGRTDKPEVNR